MEYILSTVCSGIGSPEHAAAELSEETGLKHKIGFYCEINKYARASYEANFDAGFMVEDMTKEEWSGPEFYSDVFIGGIPCQAFSLAGLRKGELDPRGLLFYDYYRYVKKQLPKAFIIENVKGLLSDANGKTFQNWLYLLGQSVNGHHQMFNSPDSLPYNLHWTVLNTKDFGIPQNRERVFLVGIRDDLPNTFRFPVGEPLKLRLKDILEPVVDEKYYLSDKAIQSIILNQENLQKSHINPDIAARLQCPGNSCGTYKGANYISDDYPDSAILRWQNSTVGIVEDLISPTLRATKGNDGIRKQPLVIERDRLIVVGNLDNVPNEMRSRVYSTAGISPTVTSNTGGGHQPKILQTNMSGEVYENDYAGTLRAGASNNYMLVKEATNKGFDIAYEGNSINLSNPNSTTPRGRVGEQIANTLDTACNQAAVVNHRIRRLTPLECWRLQGFSDEAFYKAKEESVINATLSVLGRKKKLDIPKAIKGMSDSQLYKQAGNSMTKHVIKGVLKNILNCIFTTS